MPVAEKDQRAPPARTARSPLELVKPLARTAWPVVLIVAALALAWMAHVSDNWLMWQTGYAMLIASGLGTAVLLRRWTTSRAVTWGVLAVSLAACVVESYTAEYVDRWQREPSEQTTVHFSDVYRRPHRLVYRTAEKRRSEDGELLSVSQGPMTETNKPHGHWQKWIGGRTGTPIDQWFWYGERISEGEWHLRNR